jgi:hypothetical protein
VHVHFCLNFMLSNSYKLYDTNAINHFARSLKLSRISHLKDRLSLLAAPFLQNLVK